MTKTSDTVDTVDAVDTIHRSYRYSPPWSPLSPVAKFCYWRLEGIISAGLWVVQKLGFIEDYATSDIIGVARFGDDWPESLDNKHFGRYTVEEVGLGHYYKMGRLVVIIVPNGWKHPGEVTGENEGDSDEGTAHHQSLRYAPPWPEPSPRECYWYSRLARVISAGLWMTKKLGRIEDYVVVDVLDPVEAWPESLDGKHFGRYAVKGFNRTSFYKIGRMVVVVDLIQAAEAAVKEAQGD